MIEFEVAGQKYKSGRMDAMKQFHVARRLVPVVGALAPVLAGGGISGIEALAPIADAIARLPDADCDYVLGACFGVVQREQPNGTGWAWMWSAQAGRMLFDDIDLAAMLQIAGRVLQDNLSGFLPALPSLSSGGAAAAVPSNG